MDTTALINLIISLFSGVIGGNVAGAAMQDKSLGPVGNSVAGLVGGGIGGYILQALDVLSKSGTANLDPTSILANVGTSGVGGAVLLVIVALIKNAMKKT